MLPGALAPCLPSGVQFAGSFEIDRIKGTLLLDPTTDAVLLSKVSFSGGDHRGRRIKPALGPQPTAPDCPLQDTGPLGFQLLGQIRVALCPWVS